MKNAQVDAFINNAEEFAQPILTYMRDLIHEACPQIVESLKWGMPSFDYKGPVIVMGSFKHHMSVNFWKSSIMSDSEKVFDKSGGAMGSLGRIVSIEQLPAREVLLAYIYEAIDLNEKGIKPEKKKKQTGAVELPIPEDFLEAMNQQPLSMSHFQEMSPSHRKDYIIWINEAKRVETRKSRIEKAVLQLLEKKSRDWKYQR